MYKVIRGAQVVACDETGDCGVVIGDTLYPFGGGSSGGGSDVFVVTLKSDGTVDATAREIAEAHWGGKVCILRSELVGIYGHQTYTLEYCPMSNEWSEFSSYVTFSAIVTNIFSSSASVDVCVVTINANGTIEKRSKELTIK